MKKDPAVRRDGKCARCRQPKPTASPKSQIRDLAKLLKADPFCSSMCARKFHGVKLLQEERPEYAHRKARPGDFTIRGTRGRRLPAEARA